MAEQDAGLGLKEFLGGTPSQPKVEAEKPAGDTRVEKPVEAKAAPAEPARLDKDAKGEGLKEGKNDKSKLSSEPKDKPADGPNWDDDTNPWKQKAGEFEKRYKDTHRDWNRLNQEKLDAQRRYDELARQLSVVNKKLDGTYDPQRDEPPPPDPTAIRTWGTIEGKATASYASAVREHGEDTVIQALEKYAQIFGQDKGVQERILLSNDPVRGAMEAVRAFEFAQQYGSDPTSILTKARAEWEASELPKLEARIKAELSARQPEPKGIGKVQGSSGAMDSKIAKDNRGNAKPLSAVFGR